MKAIRTIGVIGVIAVATISLGGGYLISQQPKSALAEQPTSDDNAPLTFTFLPTEWGDLRLQRAKIQGGWLVSGTGASGAGLTFVPDVDHTWTGRGKR